MHNVSFGSGALYIAEDEQNSYRGHTKSDEGMLLFLADDPTCRRADHLAGLQSGEIIISP